MSDKRATYAIGAIVVAFALVFGMTAGSTSLTTMSAGSLDPMQMSGHVTITLTDADNNIKAYRQTDNVIVEDGMDCSADLLFGITTGLCAGTASTFTSIAIGSDSTGAQDTDFELGTEITVSNPVRGGTLDAEAAATGGVGAKKTIGQAFAITATDTVEEVGLFDTDTSESGQMLSRIIISPAIPVLSGDTVTITYVVEVG